MGMRVSSLLFLFALLWAPGLLAQELANYPGWTLTRIQSESEDGSYDERQYFSLRPPDGRPPVTVDYATATRLKKGGLEAEAAYGAAGGSGPQSADTSAPAKASGGEYVYDSANAGFVQADPILSTAPADERPAQALMSVESQASESRSLVDSPTPAPSSFSKPEYAAPGSGLPPPSRAPAGDAVIPTAIPPSLANSTAISDATSSSSAPPATPSDASASAPIAAASDEKDTELRLGGDPAQRKPAAVAGVGGLVANNRAQGFGIKQPGKDSDGKGGMKSGGAKEIEEILPPCTPGRKVFTSGTLERIPLPKGCHVVMITAWGAGGGAGFSHQVTEEYGWYQQNGPGGAGAFVSASGDVDAKKYDLVVAVGSPGENASQGKAGKGGFPGGGDGGLSSTAPGGGGGGFTGVFLVEKEMGGKLMRHGNALVIAAGGGGGAGRGAGGGGAGIEAGEGGSRGGKAKSAGTAAGNAKSGAALNGGEGGSGLAFPGCHSRVTRNGRTYCSVYESEGGYSEVPEDQGSAGGGGGGGGYYGGAGGSGAASGGNSEPGGGGSSFGSIQVLLSSPGQGSTPGFHLHPNRGGAGSPGHPGRLEIEWY